VPGAFASPLAQEARHAELPSKGFTRTSPLRADGLTTRVGWSPILFISVT
jgi:hypothetical protein